MTTLKLNTLIEIQSATIDYTEGSVPRLRVVAKLHPLGRHDPLGAALATITTELLNKEAALIRKELERIFGEEVGDG